MWRCPLCQSSLATDTVWYCENNHRFDVSKRGYVNLLPVHKKGSKQPGDSKDMLSARQTFHQTGGYQPLMDKMATLLISALKTKTGELSLYDAGCGEGSYLNEVQCALQSHGVSVSAAGSDIAKSAVDFAARQYKQAQFVVASSFDLPVEDNAVDVVLQVFAPGDDKELHRILKPGGLLLHVAPGPEHLYALKSVAYQTPRKHEQPVDHRTGFVLQSREPLSFDINFSSAEQISALLMMTPFTWRLSEEKRESLVRDLKQIEADFVVSLWTKSEAM